MIFVILGRMFLKVVAYVAWWSVSDHLAILSMCYVVFLGASGPVARELQWQKPLKS
jgi:hypothetical protein